MRIYKVGDSVKVVAPYFDKIKVGMTGICVYIHEVKPHIGVEFNNWSGGHGCDGYCKNSSAGYYIRAENLELISTRKEGTMKKCITGAFKNTDDAVLIEEHFGEELGKDFLAGLTLQTYKEQFLTEAKRREEESKENKS